MYETVWPDLARMYLSNLNGYFRYRESRDAVDNHRSEESVESLRNRMTIEWTSGVRSEERVAAVEDSGL